MSSFAVINASKSRRLSWAYRALATACRERGQRTEAVLAEVQSARYAQTAARWSEVG